MSVMKDEFQVRIYYEDTDCGGVVYYANYLRYFERARTEFLESRGLSLKDLMDEGIFFVVAEASLKYHAPGRYGDLLTIESVIDRLGPASIVFSHRVLNAAGVCLVEGSVRLGCVGRDMRPQRLAGALLAALTPEG